MEALPNIQVRAAQVKDIQRAVSATWQRRQWPKMPIQCPLPGKRERRMLRSESWTRSSLVPDTSSCRAERSACSCGSRVARARRLRGCTWRPRRSGCGVQTPGFCARAERGSDRRRRERRLLPRHAARDSQLARLERHARHRARCSTRGAVSGRSRSLDRIVGAPRITNKSAPHARTGCRHDHRLSARRAASRAGEQRKRATRPLQLLLAELQARLRRRRRRLFVRRPVHPAHRKRLDRSRRSRCRRPPGHGVGLPPMPSARPRHRDLVDARAQEPMDALLRIRSARPTRKPIVFQVFKTATCCATSCRPRATNPTRARS